MITEFDLLKLRYHVIARSVESDNSLELIHSDYDDRGYLVRLQDGEVQIVYPFLENKTKKPCFKTDNVEELIAWHYHY